MRVAAAVFSGVVMLTVGACGPGGRDGGAAPPVAVDLAPSQTTASTVTAPTLPPPCALADLEWTAVRSPDAEAAMLVRVGNVGGAACELDVSRSAIADAAMEPDVWIEPGSLAELRLIDTDPGCSSPQVAPAVELDANGTPVEVTTGDVGVQPWCELRLVAIYPVESGEAVPDR